MYNTEACSSRILEQDDIYGVVKLIVDTLLLEQKYKKKFKLINKIKLKYKIKTCYN